MQKSAWNGSQGISVGETSDGTGVGKNGVLVGIAFVLANTGVAITSVFVQDTRRSSKKRNTSFGVSQFAGMFL
jgi:hypothetical protein